MIRDIAMAVRSLLKRPAFLLAAVLILAVGIGANTAMFAAAKAVLFRPLGFERADQLVWLRSTRVAAGVADTEVSWREIEDTRASSTSFQALGTFGVLSAPWEEHGRAEEVEAIQVTQGLVDALRLRSVLGRPLQASDAAEGAEAVAMVSEEFWRSRLGARPEVLGSRLRWDRRDFTIVGVVPAGFEFPLERLKPAGTGSGLPTGAKDLWLPLSEPKGQDRTSRGARMFVALGRLAPGVTLESARAEVVAIGQRVALEHPETNRGFGLDLLSMRDQVLGRTRQALPLVAAAVAAVLLMGCVNLAHLLVARGVERRREMALRLALGAGRHRLLRSAMIEAVVLAVMGGGLGWLVAVGTLRTMRHLGGGHVPFLNEASVDAAGVAFTVGLSVLTVLVFGLVPAWHLTRIDPADALRAGARASSMPGLRRWHQGMLMGQTSAVLVLLLSSVLLLESYRRLMGLDLGYRPDSVMTLDVASRDFSTNGEVCRMYRRLRELLASIPGVSAVGTISSVPLTSQWNINEKPQVVGRPVPEADRPVIAANFVAFDYFQAMRIPLVEGRYFFEGELDDDGYGLKVILNQAAAKTLFPGESAVGGRFTVGSNPDRVLEVIGVVRDTRDVRLEDEARPRFYWQYAFGGAQVVVRTEGAPEFWLSRVNEALSGFDSRVQVKRARTMREIISETVAERRFLMVSLTAYSALALGLAFFGIFAVASYQVSRRRAEFGIRLALGSTQGGLFRLVLVQVAVPVLAGIATGLGLSLATGRFLASEVFGLSPYNPWILGSGGAVLLLAALVAGFHPARRAALTHPMESLRAD
jgi:putative ABC transport system permease protein